MTNKLKKICLIKNKQKKEINNYPISHLNQNLNKKPKNNNNKTKI